MVALDGQRERLGQVAEIHGGSVVLASDLAAVPAAREKFLHALGEAGAPAPEIEAWRLLFTEALTNAIRHGCEGIAEAVVTLEWIIGAASVRLEIGDPGQGPPAALHENPLLPEDDLAVCGRGLFIIASLCDRHEHWVSGRGYRQTIVRRVDGWWRPVEALPTLPVEMDALLDELSTTYESLAAFHRMGAALISAQGADGLVREGLRSLELILPIRHGLLRLCLSDNILPEVAAELTGVEAVLPSHETPPLVRQVLADGQSFFWESRDTVRDDALLGGFPSGCCFPVIATGKTLGCILVADSAETGRRRAEDWTNLRAFSDLLGIALANCNLRVSRGKQQRAMKELELAAEIQRNLLPILPPPVSRDWEIILRHTSAHEVAGDYVEACRDAEGNLVMAIIDVMGKGVSAAMMATLFRNGLHTNLARSQRLAELVVSINDVLSLQFAEVTMFITCSLVRIDRANTRAEFINAGHAPVILLKNGRVTRQIHSSGPPLGLFPNAEYGVESVPLAAFDRLLMVTDGLFEWEIRPDDRDGAKASRWWGWENLLAVATETADKHPDVFWNKVERTRRSQTPRFVPIKDDQTMLYWTKKKKPRRK